MSVARTAARRRAQAKKKYRHMAPQDRPHYRHTQRAKAGLKAKAAIARGWRG
jgi:hypothetical protein